MNRKLISILDDLASITESLTPWEVEFVDSVVEAGRRRKEVERQANGDAKKDT